MMCRHDTRLTGAMVARACGAYQGAEVTSAGFEASGDLQTASEERDLDEAGTGTRMRRERDELVATGSRVA